MSEFFIIDYIFSFTSVWNGTEGSKTVELSSTCLLSAKFLKDFLQSVSEDFL